MPRCQYSGALFPPRSERQRGGELAKPGTEGLCGGDYLTGPSFKLKTQLTLTQKKEARRGYTLTLLASSPQSSETKSSQKPEEREPLDVVSTIGTWKNQAGSLGVVRGSAGVIRGGPPFTILKLPFIIDQMVIENVKMQIHFQFFGTIISTLASPSSLTLELFCIFYWV